MVNISIDVTDLGGEARPGDKVIFWRPRMGGSATHAGRVISTAPVTVFLTDGKATVSDVEPGEMTVLLQCRGVESQGPVTVGVPDGNGTVTLRALLESQFEYAPPIVSAVQEAASNASASEEAAIQAQIRSEAAADRADAKVDDAINNGANLVRNEVKQDADRAVSARQAATQSESNAAASESAAASSASSAATSETNAKQSEDNAGDYAAVATTAATEAVDAMERATEIAGGDFATHEYVDSGLAVKADKSYVDEVRWKKSLVKSGDTLDSLSEGTHEVANRAISLGLGIPYGLLGSITIYNVGNARTASYITSHATNPREYINSRVSGVWSGWSRHASAGDLESKADKSALSALATKEYVDNSIAGITSSDPPAPAIYMALLGAPVTPWESAGIVTNYAQGELYLEQVTTQINNVQRVKIGSTYKGNDITALVIGDTSKPVVMLEGGIHGNEVAPREALFIWARKAAQYRTWMDDICLVIIPTVNGDRTGHNRENAQNVDINRSFGDASTSEAQAVISAFETYQPVFYLSCHEFEWSNSENDIETGNTDFEGLAENIRTESVRVESAIWQAVQGLGASVGSYPASQIPGPGEPITTARTWVSVVKNTPAVLIETGGGLYPKTYATHIGVHPARYNPPLGWRVDLYHAALDASLDEISHMVQEQVIQ